MAKTPNRVLRPALIAGATIPRLLGAFFLPNAFGDAYVYIRDIGVWSTKISTGHFHLTDLFGFWLPLYQLVASLLNVVIKNGFYSGKIVSAMFGGGACLFVYAITLRLTQNQRAAWLMFLLIALNPLHIFYSASAMTDVPHAFFVMAALYFVLDRRWMVAAIFGALAGLTRVESWMLILLIPLIQFVWERRVSLGSIVVQLVPPAFWFYISWKVTGNWLACFQQREQYRQWLLIQNPDIARFSLINVLRDTGALLVSAEAAVLLACIVTAGFWFRNVRRLWKRADISESEQLVLAPVLFVAAFLTLVIVAYLTHQQPIIFPRYGLILFSLGLPVLAWVYLWARKHQPQMARRLLITAAVLLTLDVSIQLALTVGTLRQIAVQRAVADYLRTEFDPRSQARIFCDEGTVRVMSGIAENRFVTSSDAPREPVAFLSFLKEKQVEYLVFVDNQPSTPNKIFDYLEADADYGAVFQRMFNVRTVFLPTEIWVYRVHRDETLKARETAMAR